MRRSAWPGARGRGRRGSRQTSAAGAQAAEIRAGPANWGVDWVLTILGIMLLIVLHGLRHFVAAKAVGMRVERFSAVLPASILKVKKGRPSMRSGPSRAGGYVKITGMDPEEIKDLEPEVTARAY